MILKILEKICKQIRKIDFKTISDIINLSFSTGVFCKTMKIAKTEPVFKKDGKIDCNNYRLISLLPNLGRIFA